MPRRRSRPGNCGAEFDAVLLTGGAELQPRPAGCPAASCRACTSRWSFCRCRTRSSPGDKVKGQITATGKHVVVLVAAIPAATASAPSNRHGAASVTQFELMPMPPQEENRPLTWPYWPYKLRTSSSHEEGCEREFCHRHQGNSSAPRASSRRCAPVRVDGRTARWSRSRAARRTSSATWCCWPWALSAPVSSVLEAFGVERDRAAMPSGDRFDAGLQDQCRQGLRGGDMRRGQSLIVWAIREGRQAARCGRPVPDGAQRAAELGPPLRPSAAPSRGTVCDRQKPDPRRSLDAKGCVGQIPRPLAAARCRTPTPDRDRPRQLRL